MKHAVIDNPKLIGCINCSPIPNTKLSKRQSLYMGFGIVQLRIDNNCVWSDMESNKTVGWLTKKYKEKLDNAECSTLFFNSALHDETYEYNKKDGEWYLIEQGQGFV